MISVKPKAETTIKHRRHSFGSHNLIWLMMAMPAILLIFIFAYIPMPGVVLAFKNFNYAKGLFASPWVGFNNFNFFFHSLDFWPVTRNTIVMNVLFLVFGQFVNLIFAILLYEITSKKFLKLYQTVMFFPYFLSWVVVGYMLYAFLNMDRGIINSLLTHLNLPSVGWYLNSSYWPFILLFISIWKGTGVGCVLYYANMVAIDKEYFEAAEIDGANKVQITTHITIPFLMPMVTLFFLLGIGSMFRADFGMFYILPQNSSILYPTTQVIDTYVYYVLQRVGDIGRASAVGLYQSFMGFVLIVSANLIIRKFQPDNALF